LNIPIFHGFSVDNNVKREDLKLEQIKSKREKLLLGIEMEIRKTIRKIKEIDEIIEYQNKIIGQAEESLALARVRYENALITSAEVMEIEASLTSAKMEYLELVYGHNMSMMSLKKAMGFDSPLIGDFR
jgi:outer membrane protein TolC